MTGIRHASDSSANVKSKKMTLHDHEELVLRGMV